MLTLRLLGCNGPIKQITRSFNFFRRDKTPKETELIIPASEITEEPKPKQVIIPKRQLPFLNPHIPPKQAWVENLDTTDRNLLGIIDLHPEVFATNPRIDLIHENIIWQRKYRYVNWKIAPVRIEIKRSLRKPWPQKGTGRARHGTRRSHIFKGGAVCHGPRGPKTEFFMLPFHKRVLGLCNTLTVKFAQDDIHFVDSLDIPTTEPDYLISLAEQRKWGQSVLFVDTSDVLPYNTALALNSIKHFNAMPVYGLNCYSMLKHETLVLTLDAVDRIEEKLLQHLHGMKLHYRSHEKEKTNL